MANNNNQLSQKEALAIHDQMNQILQSSLFSKADRQSRFLKYIVESYLAGLAERLNQFLIGVEVFDRDESFDPAVDSTVRVEAGRLRSKLREYYSEFGQNDLVLIELPKGGYAPRIQIRKDNVSPDTAKENIDLDVQTPESILDRTSIKFKLATVVLLFVFLIVVIYIGILKPREINTTGKIAFNAEKPTIAVLPFDNMSNDPKQDYFSDGITEDIITDLSKVSGLLVIARHSTFIYKNKLVNIKEVSNALGARYVLEGSVRKSGDNLRITAQLIDAQTDNHLWADRYDRKLDDIFVVQDEVTRKIVNALKINLSGMEEQRLGHHGTNNVEAHDYFLRGQEQFYLFTHTGLNNAIKLFSQAIELDQNYAQAIAWKSRVLVYTYLAGFNTSKEETLMPALALARNAIQLDELLPVAHANLAWALRWDMKFEEAIAEANKAVELDPNFADGYLWQSMILSSAGIGQAALDSINKGTRINPYYGVTYIFAIGRAYYMLGEYENALNYFNRGIERNPKFIANYIYKISVLKLLGDDEKSESVRIELASINPDYKNSPAYIANHEENL